ncbi:recombinase [Parashewanella curva]|uniref:Recombinase n=1 Tax=Parashewanella curva TaxID=2338552 RepID=A0A3L8PYI9_9GAMM|nr:recombinase [Parashewanella curva]RLV60411.1 recombinase [Parashewanella curva]
MAGIRQNKLTKHLPEHVYYDARRGSFRIKLVDGRFKELGRDREVAISVAKEYNRIARPKVNVTVEQLLADDKDNETFFGSCVDNLLNRILQEEQPSTRVKYSFVSDATRCKEFFCNIPASKIELRHVNDYINEYHGDASANVQNRKVAWLKKLFSYAIDESIMTTNPATLKKRKRVADKARQRLKLEWYHAIHEASPLWLQTAMDLSLQTTHARLEISRIRYHIPPSDTRNCGCTWFKDPVTTENGAIYGKLLIHRQKVLHKESAHVAIPIGEKLKQIIDRSKDKVMSQFVVHRIQKRKFKKVRKNLNQVPLNAISSTFTEVRDLIGCCDHLAQEQRPTFHEIRALAAHLYDKQGIDLQSRMAHADEKSTRVYTKNHVEFIEVPLAEIDTGK